MTKLEPGEGRIPVRGGEIWFQVRGGGDRPPLLLLHGGPGGTSHYLNPLAALGADRPVVFFDQLGCGRSGRITDPALMTVEAHVAQVEAVRRTLGLSDFHLYGQSWGGTLAVESYFARPEGIRSMVLSSPLLSFKTWIRDAEILIAALPPDVRDTIRAHERAGTYDAPEYQAAMQVFYRKHVVRRWPWPEDIERSFAEMGADVYRTMWGPSEFTGTGILKDYEAADRLGRIAGPVLFLGGEFDEVRPETLQSFRKLVPGSEIALTPDAAHMTIQDNPEADLRTISDFLRRRD